ncbi:MAG: DUF1292 domain-containing protein [Clostridia bacterium]|nr:DUF1292 domain-containing protein [Clostridia bacterium]
MEDIFEEDNIIMLNDEEGNDIPFEFLDSIQYEGEEYMVLLPTDDEEADEVVILRVEELNDEEESLVPVEDDTVLQKVFDLFKEQNSDVFNFED